MAAVPVFPATVYPGSCASWPVPSITTSSIIRSTWRATRGLRILRATTAGLPFVPTRSTRCGWSQTPSLATVPYAAAICTGVIAIPCPIGSVPIVEPDQRSSGGTIPRVSPGKSIPVLRPKPKRLIHSESFCGPSSCASVIVPTFDECEMIWSTVIRSVPRGCASRMIRSETWIEYGSVKAVCGVTRPSDSAALTVTTLKVEPGSYVSVTARLRWRSLGTIGKRFAS